MLSSRKRGTICDTVYKCFFAVEFAHRTIDRSLTLLLFLVLWSKPVFDLTKPSGRKWNNFDKTLFLQKNDNNSNNNNDDGDYDYDNDVDRR